MSKEDLFKLYQSAWKYYSLHANQRIKLFSIYVIFISLFSYAIAHLILINLQKSCSINLLELSLIIILSVLFGLITYFFKGLDERNAVLLNNALEFLVAYENEFISVNDRKNISKHFLLSEQPVYNFQIFTRHKTSRQGGKTHNNYFQYIFYLGLIMAFIAIIAPIGIYLTLTPCTTEKHCPSCQTQNINEFDFKGKMTFIK